LGKRRIEVWDTVNEKVIVLLTNHFDFEATTIAAIYKDRWQIEIFFKTMNPFRANARRGFILFWTAVIRVYK
jgi:IS4 transposase